MNLTTSGVFLLKGAPAVGPANQADAAATASDQGAADFSGVLQGAVARQSGAPAPVGRPIGKTVRGNDADMQKLPPDAAAAAALASFAAPVTPQLAAPVTAGADGGALQALQADAGLAARQAADAQATAQAAARQAAGDAGSAAALPAAKPDPDAAAQALAQQAAGLQAATQQAGAAGAAQQQVAQQAAQQQATQQQATQQQAVQQQQAAQAAQTADAAGADAQAAARAADQLAAKPASASAPTVTTNPTAAATDAAATTGATALTAAAAAAAQQAPATAAAKTTSASAKHGLGDAAKHPLGEMQQDAVTIQIGGDTPRIAVMAAAQPDTGTDRQAGDGNRDTGSAAVGAADASLAAQTANAGAAAGTGQATHAAPANATVEARNLSLASGPVNVEVMKMARGGGGRAVIEVTPPDQGPLRIDLRIDGQGRAHLVVEGGTEAGRARLEQSASGLRDDLAGLGLSLNLDLRQGAGNGGTGSGDRNQAMFDQVAAANRLMAQNSVASSGDGGASGAAVAGAGARRGTTSDSGVNMYA